MTHADFRCDPVAAKLWPVFVTAFLFACGPTPPGGGNQIGNGAEGPERPVDYVRAEPYPRLVLEIDHAEGLAPRSEVIERIVADLASVLDKPEGVFAVLDETLPARGDDHVWAFSDLQALADAHFDLQVEPDTVKIHVLYLDGRYTNENVLGLAWGNRTAVIFGDRIEDLCRGRIDIVNRDAACRHGEHGVLLHELGHVLGLVNNGLAMVEDHEEPDPEKARHCRHDDCVMYWAYARPAMFDLIRDRVGGHQAYAELGPECRADLEAAR